MASSTNVTRTLDNRGGDCASGFVKLLEAMESLAPGEVLQVLSTDPASRGELQGWSERSGNPVLEARTTGPFWRREFHFLIQRSSG